ncbi:MAG: response regulator transcription factor [Acidobacteria bacterium]|nr:response regulator transcription factor [Acidobacteriota bacterium]
MPKIRVLLADDHAVVAHGLRELLKDTFELVGVVHDGRALLDAAEKLHPDVIATDISMPLLNGLDAIRQIRSRMPETRFVVLTMHADAPTAVSAFRAGARGYVLKVSPEEDLIEAIQQVARGHAYVSPLIARDVIDVLLEAAVPERNREAQLTARQREVLQLIAEGRTMKEVAAILGISPRTAESHKYEIMQALGAASTADLVKYAVRAGLVGE